jgi:hypothetical protein
MYADIVHRLPPMAHVRIISQEQSDQSSAEVHSGVLSSLSGSRRLFGAQWLIGSLSTLCAIEWWFSRSNSSFPRSWAPTVWGMAWMEAMETWKDQVERLESPSQFGK